MLSRLCASLGAPLAPHLTSSNSLPMFSFPPPSALTTDETDELLRELGFGYRAPYVYSTAVLLQSLSSESKQSEDAYLHSLTEVEETKAKEALLEFKGVGPKVADCIMLFGLGFANAVPVDTHVLQIAVRDYGYKQKGALGKEAYAKVGLMLKEVWGEKSGWAQQILFTADLKAFSSWSDPLATPSATPAQTPKKEKEDPLLASPSMSVLATPSAVKVEDPLELWSSPTTELAAKAEDGLSLAERIKGRARRKVSQSPSPTKKVKRETC